jgi:uncharacterized protein YkwD
MPGTPPLGPAALPRVRSATRPARRVVLLSILLLALAALPARAHAAACPAAVEAAVLCLVNAERAERGLAAVEPTVALASVAERHAADMVARRYFAHVSPSGGTVETRARRGGYLTAPCYALGEDLGWAPPDVATAAAVVAAWMASPGHRSVILDRDFREGGVGVVGGAPGGDGPGATFVLEMGAMVRCRGARGRVRSG